LKHHAQSKEYVRALNAVKLDRHFAKPFIATMGTVGGTHTQNDGTIIRYGHREGVHALAKDTKSLNTILSASADGSMIAWSLRDQAPIWTVPKAHNAFIRSCAVMNRSSFLSASDDGTVKLWSSTEEAPVRQWMHSGAVSAVASSNDNFASGCGSQLSLFSSVSITALHEYKWTGVGHAEAETIKSIAFSPVEPTVFGACATDRSTTLYDSRQSRPLSKVILTSKSNSIKWNPLEAFYFSVANEDGKLYSFDMRSLKEASFIGKGHVSAILDLDYSPTGQEIVTGSYDSSIRIFDIKNRKSTSRDIYHTRRMTHVHSILYSMDSRFICSGSDDGNVRLWKSDANDQMKALSVRERSAKRERQALVKKFEHVSQIKTVKNNRRIPRMIKSEQKVQGIQLQSQKNKRTRREIHEKKLSEGSERSRCVVSVVQ